MTCRSGLKPEVADIDKRVEIINAFKQALEGEYTFDSLYKLYTKYIRYDSQRVEVVEIARENFGYILFKSKDANDYYLDVVKNNSAAYWNELVKIKATDAQEMLQAGSYQKALTIVAENKQ